MLYVCTSCLKEREIGAAAAWPSSCECGGTSWTSPPPAPVMTLATLTHGGAFDPAANAKALLRQPGSPLDSFRNGGAVTSLT